MRVRVENIQLSGKRIVSASGRGFAGLTGYEAFMELLHKG